MKSKIQLIVAILSLIFLNAKCSSLSPTIEDTEQCSIAFSYYNGEIDEINSVCNCRMYRFSETKVGGVKYSEAQIEKAFKDDVDGLIIKYSPNYIQRKLKYCDKIVGWSSQDRNQELSLYAKVTAYWEAMRKFLTNQ